MPSTPEASDDDFTFSPADWATPPPPPPGLPLSYSAPPPPPPPASSPPAPSSSANQLQVPPVSASTLQYLPTTSEACHAGSKPPAVPTTRVPATPAAPACPAASTAPTTSVARLYGGLVKTQEISLHPNFVCDIMLVSLLSSNFIQALSRGAPKTPRGVAPKNWKGEGVKKGSGVKKSSGVKKRADKRLPDMKCMKCGRLSPKNYDSHFYITYTRFLCMACKYSIPEPSLPGRCVLRLCEQVTVAAQRHEISRLGIYTPQTESDEDLFYDNQAFVTCLKPYSPDNPRHSDYLVKSDLNTNTIRTLDEHARLESHVICCLRQAAAQCLTGINNNPIANHRLVEHNAPKLGTSPSLNLAAPNGTSLNFYRCMRGSAAARTRAVTSSIYSPNPCSTARPAPQYRQCRKEFCAAQWQSFVGGVTDWIRENKEWDSANIPPNIPPPGVDEWIWRQEHPRKLELAPLPPPRLWIHGEWYTDTTLDRATGWTTDWDYWELLEDFFVATVDGEPRIQSLFKESWGIQDTIHPLAYTYGTCGLHFLFSAGGRYYFWSDGLLLIHPKDFASPIEFLDYALLDGPDQRYINTPDVEVPPLPGANLDWLGGLLQGQY
ncbi:hypothetical protein GGX14DRAFT_600119 [Mycena pura]|uniref:Uncharacterized protein n=1 Tax=Mycena pura TaxID=153505 RepID=A0AAD6XZ71_9AGAR|nr:hypothetical protein GGX14DRAFT_600119 [Mycena pura]